MTLCKILLEEKQFLWTDKRMTDSSAWQKLIGSLAEVGYKKMMQELGLKIYCTFTADFITPPLLVKNTKLLNLT